MEGLIGQPIRLARDERAATSSSRLIERWLLVLFVAMLLIISIAGLVAQLGQDIASL